MGTILYIARKQIKNEAIRLIRKPARLIAVLASVALIVWMLLSTPVQEKGRMDPAILQSGFLVWLLVLGTITALSALESGSSLFRLPDVNLLFVSPVSPKTILAYGLIRQTGKTFAGFAFLLFYSGMLMNAFKITAADVVVLIVGTALFLVVVQVLALCLYCIANRGPAQRASVKAGILAVPLLIALFVLYQTRENPTLTVLYQTAASPLLDAFPVVGWVRGAVFALIAGNGGRAGLYLALTAGFLALTILLLLKIDADYYEDVLSNAEKSFELRQSAKGKRPVKTRAKERIGKTGIGAGWGASVFFYKHLREDRRGGRFAPVSGSALILLLINLATAGVMALIGRSNAAPATADAMLLAGCGFSVYVLFFQSAAGDWSGELGKPYLYMVPEDPFRKLFWAGLSTVIRPAADGLAVFAVLCAALRANPFTGLACILAYASFGFLFTAGSVLGRRVLGSAPNRGPVMMLYMLLLILILLPGAAGTLIAAVSMKASFEGAAPLLAALPLVLWNTLVSFLIFYFCRNILSSCEN
ncbi:MULTISPECIES: putative ABC exporter domain-containing protein [Acutalibacteraceae]|uniref:putative ABC exporter domain-containing protein n=1 Tax=Acutalibacteraceae TaxID=3082771 RepID=UPI0013E8C91D|nr:MULTISPECIES: putative ABC exporter domain-containing protein [Acutalibacteraceae]